MGFCRMHMVYYNYRNSIWKAVFQDGKTLFHAIWCECDRVEYNKALIEMAEEVMEAKYGNQRDH